MYTHKTMFNSRITPSRLYFQVFRTISYIPTFVSLSRSLFLSIRLSYTFLSLFLMKRNRRKKCNNSLFLITILTLICMSLFLSYCVHLFRPFILLQFILFKWRKRAKGANKHDYRITFVGLNVKNLRQYPAPFSLFSSFQHS